MSYDVCGMLPPERTPRQRIIDAITGTRLSSYQLAQLLGIRERQVEEHLTHVVKTIARDKTRRFILDPARCQDCDFVFRDRRRSNEPKPLPALSKRGHYRPALRHRFSWITIWSSGQQRVRPVGCVKKGRLE